MSSLLEYFSQRAKVYWRFTSNIQKNLRISEQKQIYLILQRAEADSAKPNERENTKFISVFSQRMQFIFDFYQIHK